MLDKNDLQQIGQLLDSRLRPIDSRLKPIEEDLRAVKRSVKNLEADSRKIRKDINIIINTFDNEYLDLRQRVERIEEKVGLVT